MQQRRPRAVKTKKKKKREREREKEWKRKLEFREYKHLRWVFIYLFWFVFFIIFTAAGSNQSFHSPAFKPNAWFSSVHLLSRVWLFATLWTAACQASLSITNSRSLPKLMSIESVMPSNHFILCHPLLLLPSIFPNIRVFSKESALLIRWPKYWSFRFNISPSKEHPGLISFRMDWLDLLAFQRTSRVFSNTTVQNHQFFCA